MSTHPLKMKDKLKGKKRPTAHCTIFVGDPDKHKEVTQESYKDFASIVKTYKPEEGINDTMLAVAQKVMKNFAKQQEPFFQRFVFRAMHPVSFEQLADEYPPREGTEDVAYNFETFPRRIFKECLVEPEYSTLTDEEWDEFFENCSQKERRLLLDTAMTCNMRNIEPATPKDLMTL